MEQVPQLYPCVLQGVWVVTPVGPVSRYWRKNGVHRGDLSQILKNLGVFVVLNAITNGLQTDPGSRLRGSDGSRRIEENSVAWSAHAPAATSRLHIVPTADRVPSSPAVRAIVKDAGGALRPIQETRLDALVDRWIVHHPFRSVARPGITTGIAPEVATAGKGQGGPLLHGIEQHPMVDGAAPVAFIKQIRVRRVGGHDGLD